MKMTLAIQDSKTGQWYEVSEAAAREKVGQQLRENLTKKDAEKSHNRRVLRRQQKQERKKRRQALKAPQESGNHSSAAESDTKLPSVAEVKEKLFPATAVLLPPFTW